MLISDFSDRDSFAVGFDPDTVIAVYAASTGEGTVIERKGPTGLTVTASPGAVTDRIRVAQHNARQLAAEDHQRAVDLLDKQIELERVRMNAEMAAANTAAQVGSNAALRQQTPGLSWGEPRAAFSRQDIEGPGERNG